MLKSTLTLLYAQRKKRVTEEIGQLDIIYDSIYPVELLRSALDMVDLCHFYLPVFKLF